MIQAKPPLCAAVSSCRLVREGRKGAQLRLVASRMMEAQIVGSLRHEGIEVEEKRRMSVMATGRSG
jgi:hypothetical protein